MKLKCTVCKNYFQGILSKQKYCSDECKKTWIFMVRQKLLKVKKCLVCHTEFKMKTINQIYCCTKCKSKSINSRRKNSRKNKICMICKHQLGIL